MKAESRTVPYVRIAAQHAPLRPALLEAVGRVLDHGQFVLGPEVEAFEKAFAGRIGVPYAVGVNSGTDALLLALRALGIGPGDEVVTVPNTFVATVSAIRLSGATPVLVDVAGDGNLDADRLAQALGPRTRAVIPVHLTGRPARVDAIRALTDSRGIRVIEDAAQAVGARLAGRPVGGLGDAGCFSLHPLKTLNACGDGGVITVRDAELARRLRMLRNIGLETRDNAAAWSGNSRLDTLQAALLLVKLGHLDAWTEARRRHAARYRERLRGVPQVRLPPEDGADYSVYHTFVIRVPRRDALKRDLEDHGIGTAVHYPVPVHLQAAGRELGYAEGSFPEAERQAATMLSLPIHQDLSPDDVDYVADRIRAFYAA